MKPSFSHRMIWIITTLQEAFSAIVPYFLLVSFITLSVAILRYFNLSLGFATPTEIARLSSTLNIFSSFVIVIAVAYAFAKRFQISTVISSTLAMAAYATAMFMEGSIPVLLSEEGYGFSIQPLLIPILSSWFLHLCYPRFSLRIPLTDANAHIYRLFNYVLAFSLAYFATIALYGGASWLVERLSEGLLRRIDLSLPTLAAYELRELLVQILWFLGIHGDHTVNALFGKEFLQQQIFPHLSIGEFNRLFVSIGGSGVGMALLFALIRYTKKGTLRLITRISIPFVIFNINTLLIYAVVVFNRYLFVPFVLLPLFNIVVAHGYLSLVDVTFTAHKVVWTTPIFLDSTIKAENPFPLYLLQLFLLIVDTLVYSHYIRRFIDSQSQDLHTTILEKNLNIPSSIRANQHIAPFIARKEIIESNAKLLDLLENLNTKNLMIYYQPKVDLNHGECTHFEALIRYRKNGRVTGPDFLELIEKARLAHLIDIWVAQEVGKALGQWYSSGFYPTININLHPDTLANPNALKEIVKPLEGKRINFEIVERSFTYGSLAIQGIQELQGKGFGISIDDYGTGYSNIETIIRHKIDELKIDKTIVDLLDTTRGTVVCRKIVEMGSLLEIEVVAEGVETPEQVAILQGMNIDYLQGFYFSKALPFEKVIDFSASFSKKFLQDQ